MKLIVITAIVLLAGCGASKGDSDTSKPSPIISYAVVAEAPTDLFFNQKDQIEITVTNTGSTNIRPTIFVTMDGFNQPAVDVPILTPGQIWNGGFQLWNSQDMDKIHTFVLRNEYGWTQTFVIQYHKKNII